MKFHIHCVLSLHHDILLVYCQKRDKLAIFPLRPNVIFKLCGICFHWEVWQRKGSILRCLFVTDTLARLLGIYFFFSLLSTDSLKSIFVVNFSHWFVVFFVFFFPNWEYRIWPACEGENAPQHPSPIYREPQHEGRQMCRLPGHCAFWTTGRHLSRLLSLHISELARLGHTVMVLVVSPSH